MIITKEKGMIIAKKNDKAKGSRIDLTTGEVISLTTNKPYARQTANNLIGIVCSKNDIPDLFTESNAIITTVDEPTSIVALYFHLTNEQRASLPHYITVLQMFYNRKYHISFESIIKMGTICIDDNELRTGLVNYIIEQDIGAIQTPLELNIHYALYQQGLHLATLDADSRKSIQDMIYMGFSTEQMRYFIRKIVSDHILLLLGVHHLSHYLDLCRKYNEDYNQKNFLKTYLDLQYRVKVEEEERNNAIVREQQRDIFKFDTDEYYCVMPTTMQEFYDMGKKMRNCIAGYYSRVADRQCQIIFVYSRETEAPIANVRIVKNYRSGVYTIVDFLGFANNWNVHNQMNGYQEDYARYLETIRE